MYLKLTLLAVLFCLVQANASNVALDEANSEWEKLKNLVENAINEANNRINSLLDWIKGKAQDIINKTTQEINDEVNRLTDDVNALKDSAKEVGVDISECIGENEDSLENFTNKLVEDLQSCVTGKISQAEEIVSKLLNKFKEASDLVLDFGNQIEFCRTSGQEFTCLLKVNAKIALVVSKIPLEIGKELAEVVDLIKELQASIVVCAADETREASEEARKIVERINNCVNNKVAS